MGQYFYATMKADGEDQVYFARHIIPGKRLKKEIMDAKDYLTQELKRNKRLYTMAKLMEQAYLGTWYVEAAMEYLAKLGKPAKVAWVGDYAEADFAKHGMQNPHTFYNQGNPGIELMFDTPEVENQYFMADKFLVNEDKKEYLDMSRYYSQLKDSDADVINPLPILTAIGNGEGGGDYYGKKGKEDIGRWALDHIAVTDKAPGEGYKEFISEFEEDYDQED